MKNFKGEKYPENIYNFTNEIILNCSNLMSARIFSIKEIFQEINGKRFVSRDIELLKNNRNEIKGLYAFLDSKDQLYYVGISQSVIRRLKQHLFGKLHNQATLVFIMANEQYKVEHGKPFTGKRTDFPFADYCSKIQDDIRRNTKFIICPVMDNMELYLSEILCSCYYKPYWNTFETH